MIPWMKSFLTSEATVDCKHGILTGVGVCPANEKESILILRHLEWQISFGVPTARLALDRVYETGAVHRGLELLGIIGYIPAIQFSNPPKKYGFSYDPQRDTFICPEGALLHTTGLIVINRPANIYVAIKSRAILVYTFQNDRAVLIRLEFGAGYSTQHFREDVSVKLSRSSSENLCAEV